MCDTIVATPKATKEGVMLFGKNSDREADEAQNIDIRERQKYELNSTVKCTYIEIPQVKETNRILLSKPYWMFGAEIGMNEHGVTIGNEALMTRVKPAKTGLTGMDLLRLALERSSNAIEARDVIINLLETYGQGGNCGYRDKLYYMNGFIIADYQQAIVLETVEKNWAWKEIKGVWSISNKISLEHDYDARSEGLITHAINNGWCKSEDDFNFTKNYSNKLITWGAAGKKREQTNRCHLQEKKGRLTIQDLMQMLRFHTNDSNWRPYQGLRMTVCAHAANNLTKHTQTTNSLVSQMSSTNFSGFTTGSANPCMSPFFPIFAPGTTLPSGYKPSGEFYNQEHFWWFAEKIHRQVVLNYLPMMNLLYNPMAKYEREMISEIESENFILDQKEINNYFEKARILIKNWGENIPTNPVLKTPILFRRFWRKYNKLNKID
ncbi:hypothetical protein NEF87_002793 [Candidatus Lokiarchaeum ossiferum]|uniref:Membrane dipeptidase n=1 Tax=Candidatus Lokiarchaeum ossiferum TaxID=2951803 RepID=A0ABY6HSM1_9ARCH|nr:hypothetical protein NEF87_002793 [Candidatus Lokiarchaeum sp. B-35]